MKERPKKAWLITWEDLGFEHWHQTQPRVVAVLSPRFSPERVKDLLIAIWCAKAELTLSERRTFGLDRKAHSRMFMVEGSEHFNFGNKPFLYARKVTSLRCIENNGLHTLHWKDTAIYRWDKSTNRPKIVRQEFEDSSSQHEKEVFGKLASENQDIAACNQAALDGALLLDRLEDKDAHSGPR
jgi:hypothetical protein